MRNASKKLWARAKEASASAGDALFSSEDIAQGAIEIALQLAPGSLLLRSPPAADKCHRLKFHAPIENIGNCYAKRGNCYGL